MPPNLEKRAGKCKAAGSPFQAEIHESGTIRRPPVLPRRVKKDETMV
jgi:hypothetical protein